LRIAFFLRLRSTETEKYRHRDSANVLAVWIAHRVNDGDLAALDQQGATRSRSLQQVASHQMMRNEPASLALALLARFGQMQKEAGMP